MLGGRACFMLNSQFLFWARTEKLLRGLRTSLSIMIDASLNFGELITAFISWGHNKSKISFDTSIFAWKELNFWTLCLILGQTHHRRSFYHYNPTFSFFHLNVPMLEKFYVSCRWNAKICTPAGHKSLPPPHPCPSRYIPYIPPNNGRGTSGSGELAQGSRLI